MGHAQVWLAVRAGEKPLGEFLRQLGFRGTGNFQKFVEARFVVTQTRSGWFILVANRAGDRLVQDNRLESLSAGCDLIAGEAEEHIMVSWLSGWRNGRKIWSVLHNPEKGREHLEIFGEPPAPFTEIHARLIEEMRQAGEDGVDYIFDVPTELSRALTGYKHDENVESTNPVPYEILESTEVVRPFWKKVFGLP